MLNKLLITVGLPASGKTYFSDNYLNEKYIHSSYNRKPYLVHKVDLDFFMKESYKYINIESEKERMKKILQREINYDLDEIIIDGLLLSTEGILEIFRSLKFSRIKCIEIHYWIEDRESCLWNDQYRREKDSITTIKNANLAKIELNVLKQNSNGTDVVLVKHNVEKKPRWKLFAEKYEINLNRNNCLESEEWCKGGTGRNYMGDEWTVYAESPVQFTELDRLLERVCPSIGFLQYKRISNDCVSEYSRDGGDYYSSIDNGYFECNIVKLYSLLIEMNLINEE